MKQFNEIQQPVHITNYQKNYHFDSSLLLELVASIHTICKRLENMHKLHIEIKKQNERILQGYTPTIPQHSRPPQRPDTGDTKPAA